LLKSPLEFSANKVTKLEEWLLTPPVYSLRKTHAYDELLFAEPSEAEQVLQAVTLLKPSGFFTYHQV
jgi:hypothetical protein